MANSKLLGLQGVALHTGHVDYPWCVLGAEAITLRCPLAIGQGLPWFDDVAPAWNIIISRRHDLQRMLGLFKRLVDHLGAADSDKLRDLLLRVLDFFDTDLRERRDAGAPEEI